MTKVSLNALNEFIVGRIKMAWEFGLADIFRAESIEGQVATLMEKIPVSSGSESGQSRFKTMPTCEDSLSRTWTR